MLCIEVNSATSRSRITRLCSHYGCLSVQSWDKQVEADNRWTQPVSSKLVEAARRDDWELVLTPHRAVPRTWYPPVKGARVLALASGGGQQGPILAAAGADVTVFDAAPKQLTQD